MKLLLTTLAIWAMGASSQAQTTTTLSDTGSSSFSLKNYYNKVKTSPFSMAYLNDTYTSFKADGVSAGHYLYMNYKMPNNDKLAVVTTFTTDMTSNVEGTSERVNYTEYKSTSLRYYRTFLTEKDHGVSLSSQVRYDIYNDNTRSGGKDGSFRAINTFSKTFGKLSLRSTLDAIVYNRNSSDATTTHILDIGQAASYSVTDAVSASAGFTWYKYFEDDSDKFTEQGLLSLSMRYSFKNGLSVSPYFETYVVKAQDERDVFADDIIRNGSIGATAYYSWF